MERARLIEPGVSYFLEETLKNCHKEKWRYNNLVINGFLLTLLLIIVYFTLYHLKFFSNNDP